MRLLRTSTYVALIFLVACENAAPPSASEAPGAAAAPAEAQNPAGALTPSSAAGAASPSSETDRLNAWLDARFEESLDFSPMTKTRLGRKDDNDRLNLASEAALDEQYAWLAATVDELRASFDRNQLTPEGQTSHDVWVDRYDQAEAALPWRRYTYLFNQMRGEHSGLPQFLITTHLVADET